MAFSIDGVGGGDFVSVLHEGMFAGRITQARDCDLPAPCERNGTKLTARGRRGKVLGPSWAALVHEVDCGGDPTVGIAMGKGETGEYAK